MATTNRRGLGRRNAVRGGRGQRQGSGKKGSGGTKDCECPKCGHTETHVRGTPCANKKCPKCGTQMVGKFCKYYLQSVNVL